MENNELIESGSPQYPPSPQPPQSPLSRHEVFEPPNGHVDLESLLLDGDAVSGNDSSFVADEQPMEVGEESPEDKPVTDLNIDNIISHWRAGGTPAPHRSEEDDESEKTENSPDESIRSDKSPRVSDQEEQPDGHVDEQMNESLASEDSIVPLKPPALASREYIAQLVREHEEKERVNEMRESVFQPRLLSHARLHEERARRLMEMEEKKKIEDTANNEPPPQPVEAVSSKRKAAAVPFGPPPPPKKKQLPIAHHNNPTTRSLRSADIIVDNEMALDKVASAALAQPIKQDQPPQALKPVAKGPAIPRSSSTITVAAPHIRKDDEKKQGTTLAVKPISNALKAPVYKTPRWLPSLLVPEDSDFPGLRLGDYDKSMDTEMPKSSMEGDIDQLAESMIEGVQKIAKRAMSLELQLDAAKDTIRILARENKLGNDLVGGEETGYRPVMALLNAHDLLELKPVNKSKADSARAAAFRLCFEQLAEGAKEANTKLNTPARKENWMLRIKKEKDEAQPRGSAVVKAEGRSPKRPQAKAPPKTLTPGKKKSTAASAPSSDITPPATSTGKGTKKTPLKTPKKAATPKPIMKTKGKKLAASQHVAFNDDPAEDMHPGDESEDDGSKPGPSHR